MPKTLLDIVYKQFQDISQIIQTFSGFILLMEINSSKSDNLEDNTLGKSFYKISWNVSGAVLVII